MLSDSKTNIIRNWSLYIITDESLSRGRSHSRIARDAIAGGASVIQLRDKSADSRKLYQTAREIRVLTREEGVSFIINDRLDIAMACDADGVHLGQDDLPADVARKIIGPEKIMGVSAASPEEALQAEKQGADYLGVGPVFEARSTKSDAGAPLGLQLISKITSRCSLPVIAIGGINHSNAAKVIRAGADGIAVISAVVSADSIRDSVAHLLEMISACRDKR